MDQRQSLETLNRDEKTGSRSLSQLLERQQGFEEKLTTQQADLTLQTVKKTELFYVLSYSTISLISIILQLDDKISTLQADLAKARQELDNQQAERTRIA